MNPLIQLKTTPPLLITLALLCVGLSPTAKALLPAPAPDGGYPGGNTAEGINALHDVHTALGINNTAVGLNALTNDTTGAYNVAVGSGALASNTTGQQNMAIGAEALRDSNGNFNLAIGFRVLFMNTTGSRLTGIGAAALRNNTTASDNTAIGSTALRENTTGEDNTAIGSNALFSNTRGSFNTANGFSALISNTTGGGNTAIGQAALFSNTTGVANTAIGINALNLNTTGDNNIALGFSAGLNITGDNNIDIGSTGAGSESGTIRIGQSGSQTRTFIAGISGVNEGSPRAVFINTTTGQLGTQPPASSRRYKKEIRRMDKASEAILGLKPVTFRYKKELDPDGIPQFGLVAEEVEKVNPKLVVRDGEGKPYTVRYDAVNAMLLNEFLKEHRTVQGQQKEIDALKAELKEQKALIQKVSAEIESSKPAPQVVNNP